MNFIKEHKYTIMALIVFFALLILFILAKDIFLSSNNKYGSRLKDLEQYKITDSDKKAIKDNISGVKLVTVKTQGRIVNVHITVNDGETVANSKNLANKVYEKLNKNQRDYFDIQVFIKKDKEDSHFPIIGYMHHGQDKFSWTADR